MNTALLRRNLAIGVIFLFIVSVLTPIVIGHAIETSNEELMGKNTNFDRYLLQEYYSCYNVDEIPRSIRSIIFENIEVNLDIPKIENNINSKDSPKPLTGPIDSPWPMYCHDVRHTGRSTYFTDFNPGIEKWRFDINDWNFGSAPVVDDKGIIYFPENLFLYAINSNGSLKWKYHIGANVVSVPAIDENGVVYVGTSYHWDGIYAIYPNGTKKWRYDCGSIFSSPVIGNDGTIYFGTNDGGSPNKGSIYALNPNGTLKWRFRTGHVVYSSPAIGDDGIVYCGCHDEYLYALYPNNGTLKWKYKTAHWVRASPCIADDGTIYVVSLDNYLHAVNPNGTLKWKTNVGAGTSPTIGQNGTIYAGYSKLYAINPNGSVKWKFNPGSDRRIRGSTPCNSAEGTIYFGTHIGESAGGEIIAVNSNGTEKWRLMIASDWVDSAPAIGDDGTIYVASTNDLSHSASAGYLHAIGIVESNEPPSAPIITGTTEGNAGDSYTYTFVSNDPEGYPVKYFIDWDDDTTSGWTWEYKSGEEVEISHTWAEEGTYTIRAKAMDISNDESGWGTLKVTMPKNKMLVNSPFLKFLQNHPHTSLILRQLLGL